MCRARVYWGQVNESSPLHGIAFEPTVLCSAICHRLAIPALACVCAAKFGGFDDFGAALAAAAEARAQVWGVGIFREA